MREVYPNLFVGDKEDYEEHKGRVGWAYVLAAKEPYHREALGYDSLAAPKHDPEYLIAKRGSRLILNLVDVPPEKSKFIPDEIINRAVIFIRSQINIGENVLITCNRGESRGPSIAFAYLLKHTDIFENVKSFAGAERKFKKLYPKYNPSGIRDKIEEIYNSLRS